MNYKTVLIGGLMICLQASCATVSASETASGSAITGTVAFLDKDKYTCYLDAPPPGQDVTYIFNTSETLCENNSARDIQFNRLPSATRILITDLPTCEKKNGDNSWFWFEFKTTRQPTDTEFMELEYLKTYQPGQIIRPGLQLVDRYVMNGKPVRDNVSCVKIWASAAPPTP